MSSGLNDIFKHLIHPPIDKTASCSYERNFGLYVLDKKINTITVYMNKLGGNRM